ncbi:MULTISPECIES: sulfite exporter TauE/SafE family protein [Nitrosospira]|nr:MULTISPECIES: sulfite exporter TauE/SafE family protein [Nitrosospira]
MSMMAALFGALVGVILGLTGAGGAIIAVPLLVFGLQLLVAEAAPIALFAVSITAAIGALLALKQGRVRYRAAGFIALTGALASPVGIYIARKIPDAALSLLFAAVLGYIAIRMFRRSGSHSAKATPSLLATPCQLDDFSRRLIWDARCARSLALSGIAAGFLSGLLGVGGGFIIVPALQKATLLHMRTIVPTSLAVIAMVSGAGAFSAMVAGSMNWPIALPFVAGAVTAMLMASRFAHHFTGPALQKSFAILAGAVATGMGIKAIAVVTGMSS